ncbi:MAG TPA: flagellar assembly protein FliW [Candidatus Kapabacteria bacterium]|mgnify:FL=1|jgi:flagellar assembly factor FliW|nr:flagellar assembly protein FliW [Candidatus Kapabacteria bacterium]HOQ48284.1 flagellar assembly protein FliW [Candidatus Kapabacteria bacterium]HPP39813.1 flagellar assembly protein FliW [Candidatus Kapabacteria bacterium]HPU24032.1 flagellar assembly protein FliW [Candidatus Kapabacteria bacterium]
MAKKRVIKTNYFGELEIDEEYIFKFKDGMLGFEDLHDYVLISEESTAPFKWLISVDEPEIGFPLLSPWHIDVYYDPGIKYDLEKQVLFVVITLEDENGEMSANMKAPVIFNIEKQTGEQIILPSDKYTTNYVIAKKQKTIKE